METEGLDFQSARWSRWPSAAGVELEAEEEDPRAAAPARARAAAARAAERTAAYYVRVPVGVARGGARRARTCSGAG